MVVASHLLEACAILDDRVGALGQAGVLMFFVHTAMVLMQSLERLHTESPQRLAVRFYIRRFFRIYPLPIVVILLFLVIARIFPIAVTFWFARYQPTMGQLLANLSLTQNVFGVPDIIVVTWSLPPEVQMYAILPIFFAFRKSPPTFMINFWAGWVIMLTFIFGTKAFDLLEFLPMFLPGIIAYQYSKTVQATISGWLWPVAVILLMASMVLFGHKSVVLSWFTCLALGLAIPHFNTISSKIVAISAAKIAKYSYGVYLTHLGCIFAASKLLGQHHLAAKLVASAVLIVASAVILFHSIEQPLIDLGNHLASRLARNSLIAKGAAASVTN